MMETIFKAVIGITVFASGWLTVQLVWRRVFFENSELTDARASGIGCHGCGHANCETRAREQGVDTQLQITRED